MTISIKTFNELTTQELYDLLQLLSEVFVVEQNCVYQDVDDKDQKAIHVLGKKKDKIGYSSLSPNILYSQPEILISWTAEIILPA